ncbi:hypothetical protein [Frateuria defendens]|uniref:hypothetical protein n=1 Tax=Frateuria defendens TaxID=2219559 RepID=UPI00066FD69F|nr:hypothetical protein [Frateuria defendens]
MTPLIRLIRRPPTLPPAETAPQALPAACDIRRPASAADASHVDYDRQPLAVRQLDHYIDAAPGNPLFKVR